MLGARVGEDESVRGSRVIESSGEEGVVTFELNQAEPLTATVIGRATPSLNLDKYPSPLAIDRLCDGARITRVG